MAKQGRADVSGPYDRKVEPKSKAINPGGVNNLGLAQGNHATDVGTFRPHSTPLNAGRGFSAPSIGTKRHGSGSQGKY